MPNTQHLTFGDLLLRWRQYLAFIPSFVNIATFWRAHHDFFIYIKKMNGGTDVFQYLLAVLHGHSTFQHIIIKYRFDDSPAIFLYSANTLCSPIFKISFGIMCTPVPIS